MATIRCERCGAMNPPENTFCMKCGTPLTLPSGDSQLFTAEIQRLRGMVTQINARLDALEKHPPAPRQPEAPPIPVQRELIPAPVTGEPQQPPAPTKIPIEATQKEQPPKKEREWEQILGGNWLARIGVLALIFGVGFFLKYAFDNNWIGPELRVSLGGAAGFIMLGFGFWWRKRYPVLTQVLSGGGIAVFYLSIFASCVTYSLINLYAATALLLIVSVLAILLALRYNSIALSVIGIFGAYFAPFILGAFNNGRSGTEDTTQAVFLLFYTILIGLGVTILSGFRNWRWFSLLALFCSIFTYAFWLNGFGNIMSITAKQTGITVIFLIFTGATVFFHILRQKKPAVYDYLFMAINGIAYAIFSTANLWDRYEGWMGGFFLLLALFYGLLSFFLSRRSAENRLLGRLSLAVGLISLTIAIPVQFRDSVWTPILFAVEMTAIARFSTLLDISLLRYFSYILFVILMWDMLLFHAGVNNRDFVPVINGRFLVFVIGIAAVYLTLLILRARRQLIPEWPYTSAILLIIINVITIAIISMEVWNSFDSAISSAADKNSLRDARNLSLTGAWAICAVIGLVIGIWRHWRWVRIGSLGLLAATIVKVFAYDVFQLETNYRIIAFTGLGILLLASAYLYQRYRKTIKGVFTK